MSFRKILDRRLQDEICTCTSTNSILLFSQVVILMNAGDIIEQVEGLTHDKLTYFVRAGYVNPQKIKRGTLNYNDFSQRDLEIIKRAWGYISTYDMKTRSAFERASKDYKNDQMPLPFESKS